MPVVCFLDFGVGLWTLDFRVRPVDCPARAGTFEGGRGDDERFAARVERGGFADRLGAKHAPVQRAGPVDPRRLKLFNSRLERLGTIEELEECWSDRCCDGAADPSKHPIVALFPKSKIKRAPRKVPSPAPSPSPSPSPTAT